MSTVRRAHIFYHYPCPDGVFAALAAHRYVTLTQAPVVWHPMKVFLAPGAQVNMDDIKSDDVAFMMDYTGDADFIKLLASKVHSLVVMDHHKTAIDAARARAAEFPANCTLHFDLQRSGATIARDVFRSYLPEEQWYQDVDRAKIDRVYAFVEDADLWRWAIAQSKEFHSGVANLNLEYDANKNPTIFETLTALDVDALIRAGAAAIEAETQTVNAELAKSFVLTINPPAHATFPRSSFLGVITTHGELRSRMGNELAALSSARGLRGIAAIIYEEAELPAGVLKCSMRSLTTPVNENACEICEAYGGGGHINASSCNITRETLDSWRVQA